MSPPSRVSQISDDNLRALFTDADPNALYESFQSVGSGNFGTVFYAQDKATKQVVAIKKIHYSAEDRNKKEETWRMVVKEITVMHQCNHPHLVRYHNCFLRSPDVYIVMEYCLGSTADILNVNESSLSEAEIAVICNQTLQALVYLHDKNFIHRDVKACNILLSSDGKVKLGDFGTVSLSSKAASFIGTPYWMAPEVIKSEDEIMYTQTIDVWSLGICCFEFTTGYPPYHAMHVMAALYHIPNNKPDLKPFRENNYSADFLNFVSDCFKDFEDRPTSKYLLENDPFISTERPAYLLPDLLEKTINKVEQAQRTQTTSNKLKLNGKQKLLLAPVTGNTSAANIEHPNEFSSPGSDSNGPWASDGSEMGYPHSDAVDEPLYRNLPSGGDATPTSPVNASANGGYENLESVVSSGANNSSHVNNSSSSPANNIYQNQEAPGFPRGQPSMPSDMSAPPAQNFNTSSVNASLPTDGGRVTGVTPSQQPPQPQKQPHHMSQVAPAPHIISLAPGRPEHLPNMIHGGGASLVGGGGSTIGGLSKIATIKTQNLQIQEEKSKLEMKEQMSGYKEMRREHQKQIQNQEAKCKADESNCTSKIQQEYDNEKQRASKEEAKARQMDYARLQQKDRDIDKRIGKLQAQLRDQQNNERKKFEAFQKKYKKAKEAEIKEAFGMNRERLGEELGNLETETTRSREEAEAIWASQMQERIWNHKQGQLKEKLELENEVLNGEMQRRSVELDLTHRMIIRHHEQWAHLQKEHQRQIQDLRYKLMTEQHEIELQNHKRHHQLSLKNLEKQHTEETRNQPKLIKDKEKQIQLQLANALDTQNKQFMQLKQLRIDEAPRENHRDVARKLEHELSNKQETLKNQYRESIERMKESNETNLKRQHQQDEEELRQRLQKDLETLINYQKQVKFQTEQQRNKEKQELEKKIEQRFKNVQKNIEEGKKSFAEEKKMRESEKRKEQQLKWQEFQQEFDRAMAPYHRFSSHTPAAQQQPPQLQHSTSMQHGNSAIDSFSMSSQFSQSTDVSTVGGGTLVSEHHQHLPQDQPPPNGGNFPHQRHSRVFDAKFAEMSIDNDQTPPPPIPRTTSIKQSIDSRGQVQGSSTLLQISQRSSTSSNSSFQENSSSFNNSMISGTNTPMIMRNNSNVSTGGGKPEYFTNADNSPLLMKGGTSYHGSNNNNATTPVNQTPGTRL